MFEFPIQEYNVGKSLSSTIKLFPLLFRSHNIRKELTDWIDKMSQGNDPFWMMHVLKKKTKDVSKQYIQHSEDGYEGEDDYRYIKLALEFRNKSLQPLTPDLKDETDIHFDLKLQKMIERCQFPDHLYRQGEGLTITNPLHPFF